MSFPTTPLGALLREPLRNGKSARASASSEGVRVFTLTAVTKADFSEENTKVSVLRPEDADDVWAEPGDIFVERSNTPELVGTAALYTGRPRFAVFPDLLIRVRPDERLDERFLAYFLRSETARRYFRSNARGIAGTMPKISQQTIEALRVPVPGRRVQAHIVAAIETHFSRLDAAVASLTRAKANVKRARASVLKAAVEGRLVHTEAALARAEGRDYEPASVLLDRILAEREAAWAASGARGKYKEPVKPETEGLPGLPEGWCWATPGQLGSGERYDLAIGPFGSNLKVPDYRESGVPLVFVRNVRAERFSGTGGKFVDPAKARELIAHRVRPGDVVITKMGEPPGDAALYPRTAPDGIITADVIKWTACHLIHAEFLVYATRSRVVRSQIVDVTQGVAQKKISLERFLRVGYPLPPVAEQHRIVAEVDRRLSVLDALDATLDANLARCARLRQSILKRAFEGRLVPSEAPAVNERMRDVAR